jgi:Squalene-hopene cyclase C-terminal domain
VLAIIAGVGFALLAITFFVASRTRWGQTKPLTKCVVLSILAHIWLLMYAMGVRTVLPQGDPHGHENGMAMSFEQIDEPEESVTTQTPDWQQPVPLEDLPKPPALESANQIKWDQPPELLQVVTPTPLPDLSPDIIEQLNEEPPQVADVQPVPVDVPQPRTQLTTGNESPVLPPQLPANPLLPQEYQLRQHADRLSIARAYGADADTEASVEAALQWLSRAQSEDGGWEAARFGAGTETRALGEYRHNTGKLADTGITGLALLAFLSAGHTHLDGDYKRVVERGLSYLIQAQLPSGDLSGSKQAGKDISVVNARMYCHSIAMLALAEAHAMTHDQVLREYLINAARYSIGAQHVRGGWRYVPGTDDPGDLSLFGWKAMALKSVSRSGLEIPGEVQTRMRSFLDECSFGKKGGLARYRPKDGLPSETMTAESFACRLLLDYPMSFEARQEATQMIMSHLPGTKPDNVYFWYYASLALFQVQDQNWRQWNAALKGRLLQTQEPAYSSEAGSWTPDGIWGGYGGRVYSTAMSCLCLEVYYRYLPLYQQSNMARSGWPNGPSR